MVRTVNVGHDVWIFKMLKCVSLWIYWTRATGLSWDHLGDTGSHSDTLHSLHSLGYNPALVTILTTQGLRLRHPRVFHDYQPGHPPPAIYLSGARPPVVSDCLVLKSNIFVNTCLRTADNYCLIEVIISLECIQWRFYFDRPSLGIDN